MKHNHLHQQFSLGWYFCAQKSPNALHPVSQTFPQHCLWNGSSAHQHLPSTTDWLQQLPWDLLTGPIPLLPSSISWVWNFSCKILPDLQSTPLVIPTTGSPCVNGASVHIWKCRGVWGGGGVRVFMHVCANDVGMCVCMSVCGLDHSAHISFIEVPTFWF